MAILRMSTAVDATFHILKGSGKGAIGGETEEVIADMLIDSPARAPHRLFSKSDS